MCENWTTCVPNLANKRIIANYTSGPNTDIRVWNGPNEIEGEFHLLFKCTLYNDCRKIWIENIVKIDEDFVQLDKICQRKFIFDKHHPCRPTAKFIHRNFKIRKENLLIAFFCLFVCFVRLCVCVVLCL